MVTTTLKNSETGLHYNRFRYFDPDLGMFTTRDPIGLMGGVNTFQYAPNPTGWIDPFGLAAQHTYQGNTAYRTMSVEHFKILQKTRKVSATSETMISASAKYSSKYTGVLVEFEMKDGWYDELVSMGVQDDSKIVKDNCTCMSTVESGWSKNDQAYFKGETMNKKERDFDKVLNIGLGQGGALDSFNSNIASFKRIDQVK